MADQTKGLQEKTQNATKGTPASTVTSTTDSALSSIDYYGNWIAQKARGMLDSVFPPEKRAAFLSKLRAFMLANPKLSAFLGMNLFLTGLPLGLFILFTVTVFISALVIALVVALLAAVLFTLGAVGVALVIVFPTILFTTGAACFLFLWGLGGYYILKWANGGTEGESKQAPEGGSIGDTLNRWTGGRMSGFVEGARKEQAKEDISGFGDRFTKPDSGEKKPEVTVKDGTKQ